MGVPFPRTPSWSYSDRMDASVTVNGPEGPLATISVLGQRIQVDPAEAETNPLVAAVVERLRQSARRRPPRPSC